MRLTKYQRNRTPELRCGTLFEVDFRGYSATDKLFTMRIVAIDALEALAMWVKSRGGHSTFVAIRETTTTVNYPTTNEEK